MQGSKKSVESACRLTDRSAARLSGAIETWVRGLGSSSTRPRETIRNLHAGECVVGAAAG